MKAGTLAPIMVEANNLRNLKTKVDPEVPAALVAMMVQKVLIIAENQSLTGEERQRSDREAASYNRIVNSANHRGSNA